MPGTIICPLYYFFYVLYYFKLYIIIEPILQMSKNKISRN